MGWGRWLLFGDLGQQLDLAEQKAELDRLKQELLSKQDSSGPMEQRFQQLQRDNDELKLYLAATLRLMAAKGLATADEIKAMVAAVDREDGPEDKRFSGELAPKS